MASVTDRTHLAQWIDESLDYLTAEWTALAEIAEVWDTWEEPYRLDFVLEWPLREDRLRQVQRWNSDGLLTATQRERYTELQQLIEHHRTILMRLLGA